MIGMNLGTVLEVLVILWLLLTTSYFYNRKIADLGIRLEGYDWLLVVIGVTYTLVAIGLLDMLLHWNAFFTGSLAFAVSGAPMMYGAYQRHNETQARAREAFHEP